MAQTRMLAATVTRILAGVAEWRCVPCRRRRWPLYEELKPPLALSPFQRPLLLESSASSSAPQAHVYAVVTQAFHKVAPALQMAES